MGIFLGFGFFEDEVPGPAGQVIRREGSAFVMHGQDNRRALLEGGVSLYAEVGPALPRSALPVHLPALGGGLVLFDEDDSTIVVGEELPPADQPASRLLDALGERDPRPPDSTK